MRIEATKLLRISERQVRTKGGIFANSVIQATI